MVLREKFLLQKYCRKSIDESVLIFVWVNLLTYLLGKGVKSISNAK